MASRPGMISAPVEKRSSSILIPRTTAIAANGRRAWQWVQRYLVIIVVVGIWQLSIDLNLVVREYLPSPKEILWRFGELLFVSGSIWQHFFSSMNRLAIGIGITTVLGVSLGLAMGWSQRFARFTDTLVEFLRPVPPISMIPVAIFYLGIGDASKVFIICIGTFFPLLLNTIAGVKTVDPVLIKAARTLGATTKDVLLRIVIPAAFPYMFTGFRVSVGIGLMVLVAAEMVAAARGLGYFILQSEMTWKLEEMYSGIIMISLTGLIVNTLLLRLEAKYLGWFSVKQ